MESRERVIKTIDHDLPDKIPFFELGIDEDIASRIIGRKIFLYDRTYDFKYGLLSYYKKYNKIDEKHVSIGIKNTCDLYDRLDMDIVPVRIYSSFVSPFSFIYMGLTDSFEGITVSKEKLLKDIEVWKIEDSEGFWSKIRFNKKNKSIFMQSDSIYELGLEELKRFNKNAAKSLSFFLSKVNSFLKSSLPKKNNNQPGLKKNDTVDILPEQINISLNCIKFARDYDKTKDRFILGYGSLCYPTNATFHPLFLESMISDPAVVYNFMELTTEGIIPVIKAQLESGANGIICVNDYAYNNGPIFSPSHFKKFLVPFYKRIVDLCHNYNKPFIKHCDGNINSLLELFVFDCGFDAIHAIEPSAGMDIYELKKKYGNMITLIGNLDCSGLLVNGSEKQIKEEIFKLKKFIASGGGFIFSSSNSIHSGIPFDKFNIMIDTFKEVRNYG
jgi:hypothetical protein